MKRFATFTLVLALAACTRSPQEPPAPAAAPPADAPATPSAVPAAASTTAALDAATLGRYHWKLDRAVDAKGQRIEALFVRADAPVQLDFRDDRVGVSNACNRIGGRYSFEGDALTVGDLASTQMACSDPRLMALDQAISQRLQGRQTAALQSGDTPVLTLTSSGGDVLTFRGEPTAETRFGGPGETVFLEIAPNSKPCTHPAVPNRQCLQVREVKFDEQGIRTGTPPEWQPLYQDIEGFKHVEGTRNVVRVKRFVSGNKPEGEQVAYVLDMVVESEITKDAPRG
jgi:heat shock protein HslJ